MGIDDLHRWLDALGLGKYADVFAENEIESGDLSQLTDEDLRELGLPMGPRKRILGAASALSPTASPTAASAAEAPVNRTSSAPAAEAERRQLTVMFCDLVGSTALSQQLDPEELREINRAYQDAAKTAIERYEGYVARYMGDGVLAYFGYPQAHEDDAERSLHAGLALVRAIAELDAVDESGDVIELAVRVGIATGPVVVGDVIGEGASQESAVVGETPNVAARLQGIATPNSVVAASSTRDLDAGQFEYEDLGSHSLKGIAEPVHAWRVVAASAVDDRFEAVHRAGLTAFVGRDQEIGLLMDRWRAAKEGDGQIALLSGEAGIGKSRIMQVLRERLDAEPHTRVRYQCSPYHTSSALYPVVQQLELAAGFSAQDSAHEKLNKLATLLARAADPTAEVMALFAALLSIPLQGRYPPLDLPPHVQKDRTLRALIDQLKAHATQQPVFVVFEDAHWIDPTTSELVDLIADVSQRLRTLVLITFRPEFDCPWSSYPHATTLALNRLTRSQTESVILHVAQNIPLPAEVVDQIAAKTDGIPLFVEELTKNVLESGLLTRASDRYELGGPLVPLAIPASLQDSLMARLDRLATVKEIAQIGAAVGREFSYELLRGIAGRQEDDLRDALDQLTESELIFRRGTLPNATYVFKHALVQDAAYASLLKSRRQQLHANIAGALMALRQDLVETQPELLAHHFTQAGLAEPALEYWQAAANRAISRSAHREAVEQLDQALAQIALLPPGEARDRRELELHVLKLGPIFPVKGYGSPEVDEASTRALILGRTVGDDKTLFPTLYARWAFHYIRSNQKEMFGLSQEYLDRANAAGDDAACMVGHRIHAVALLYRGDIESARDQARQSLQMYVPERHIPLISRFGQDLEIQAINYLAVSDALLGNVEDALSLGAQAIAHARELNHANTLAYALWHIGVWLPSIVRDTQATHRYGTELLEFAQTNGLDFWEKFSLPHIAINGYGKARVEAAEDAEKELKIWRDQYNGEMLVPEILCRIAEAYLDEGLTSHASRVLTEATSLMERKDQVYWESELYRLRGRLASMVSKDDPQVAIEEFRRAMSIARERSTKLLELRVATDFARLMAERDEPADAKQMLSSVYDWFTGGFELPDLVDAKAMLNTLR